ncbi:hypothetical protein, unlikely [Trypanosoma brucei gambiense DAL972]|uniref:Uncharacterized protein n=1 Tax=Trypanosoma brucei gambiense (strain MHOM/CI/86/DAL972) TaxID=679716 RepID=C9ZUF8_TRYB9|nr:hypothetical protein, unlikely [Trypanosoma brucei gambiense DAL972]CBH13045.1 hypothetical protein, unlikely [Trypanosoma brucei gambiense DAL972]|eukprot:XP_011775323.1 hypothetical protein, unlikely [Trypanosoma brucei gambiense DAL972]
MIARVRLWCPAKLLPRLLWRPAFMPALVCVRSAICVEWWVCGAKHIQAQFCVCVSGSLVVRNCCFFFPPLISRNIRPGSFFFLFLHVGRGDFRAQVGKHTEFAESASRLRTIRRGCRPKLMCHHCE